MKIKRSEKIIAVILFFLVLITFSVAQEKSRIIEQAYTKKWNLRTANRDIPVKSTHVQMAVPTAPSPVKSH